MIVTNCYSLTKANALEVPKSNLNSITDRNFLKARKFMSPNATRAIYLFRKVVGLTYRQLAWRMMSSLMSASSVSMERRRQLSSGKIRRSCRPLRQRWCSHSCGSHPRDRGGRRCCSLGRSLLSWCEGSLSRWQSGTLSLRSLKSQVSISQKMGAASSSLLISMGKP